MDSFANFAVTRVKVAPVPMLAGQTLTVEDESVFAGLTPPYSVTVWPFAALEPTPDNSETLRVTARNGKQLTFTRAAEGSTAMKVWPGMSIAQLPTKLFYESIGRDAVAEAVPAAVAQAVAAAVPQAVELADTATNEAIAALFDEEDPEPLGVAAPGSEFLVARRDHVHQMPKLDGVNAPDDTTTLDATQALHGLMSKADKKKLDLGKRTLKSVTNSYTVDTGSQDQVIFCSKATPFTVTLVDATAGAGLTHYEREITIANLGAGEVTIASAAGSQIFTDSAEASITLSVGDSVNLFCNGVVWKVV
jgi:hypothetical protein